MEYTYIHNHQSQFIEMFGNPITGWKYPVTTLGDCFKIGTGGTPSRENSSFYDGIIPWVKSTEVNYNYINDTEEHLSKNGVDSSNCKLYPVGTVLMAMYGQGSTRGRVAVLEVPATVNQAIAAIQIYDEDESAFVFNILTILYSHIRDMAIGGNQKNLNLKLVSQIPYIKVPSQKRKEFAAIVRQADKSKFDGFKSQFLEWFGDMKYLTSDKTMSDFFDMKAGQSITAENIIATYDLELFPCYGGNGLRGYVTHYTHEGHYCLIGRQGALCGNVNLTDGKFFATEHAIVVTPKISINTYWLFFALSEMNLNRFARGVAQPGLSVKQLETIPFSIPPTEEQEQFERLYRQADKSKYYEINETSYGIL